MRVALLNAHTSYAVGASETLGGVVYSEYKLSSRINKELQNKLLNTGNDAYIVDGSSEKPYSRSLRYKASFVNMTGADIAIETHFNSAFSLALAKHSSGLEVLYSDKKEGNKALAEKMVEGLSAYLPFKLRRGGTGLYVRNKLYILTNIDCPTIINEICFLSHPIDRLYLLHPNSTRVIANAILNGISKYQSVSN